MHKNYKLPTFALAAALLVFLNVESSAQCGNVPLHYVETFDDTSTRAVCWNLGSNWEYDSTVSAYGKGDNALKVPFFFISSGSSHLESPLVGPATSHFYLVFDFAYAAFQNNIDRLEIYTSTDSGTSYQPLDTLLGGPNGELNTAGSSSAAFSPMAGDWDTYLKPLPMGVNRVRFRAVSGFGNNLYVDNISIKPIPPCPEPANLEILAADRTTAQLTFRPGDSALSHTLEYGPPGFSPGNGTAINFTGDTVSLMGLAAGTCYDVYLRAICAAPDSSAFIGPVRFCTKAICNVTSTPAIINDTICPGDTANVFVTAGDTAARLASFNGPGDWNAFGDSVHFSLIGLGLSVAVADFISANLNQRIGPKPAIANAGPGNFNHALYITVTDTLVIDSVTLKSDGYVAGLLAVREDSINGRLMQFGDFFELDSAGGVFQVSANLLLTPGNYVLDILLLSPQVGQLFYADSGVAYPYRLPSLMSIDSSTSGNPSLYNPLFDMVVSQACFGSVVSATPVVDTGALAGFGQSDTLCATAPTVDLRTFLFGFFDLDGEWEDLDGSGALSGNQFDPDTSHIGQSFRFRYVSTTLCDSDSTVVTLYVDGCGFRLEELPAGQISVYPNPAEDVFFIKNQAGDPMKIELYNLGGQLLLRRTADGSEAEALDVSGFADGIYNLRIITQDGVTTRRVIVQ